MRRNRGTARDKEMLEMTKIEETKRRSSPQREKRQSRLQKKKEKPKSLRDMEWNKQSKRRKSWLTRELKTRDRLLRRRRRQRLQQPSRTCS